MPNLSPYRTVSKVTSDPVPTTRNDPYKHHNGFTKGECPTSPHSRKVHMGIAHLRQTVVSTFGHGGTGTSYIDHCKCQHCGHEWKQEWMPGLI